MFQIATTSTTADSLFAAMGDHVAIFDRDWRYIYVNEGAARMLGRRPDELVGQRIWDLFPEAIGNQFYTELHRADAERTVVHFDFYYAPWDKWFENHTYPLADGLALISRDITARRAAEDQLRRSEARLRDALDAARMATWRMDVRTAMIQLSDNAGAVLGAPSHIMPAAVVRGWVHPDDLPAHQARVRATLDSGEPYVSEIRVCRPDDGRTIWMEVRGHVERDAHGAIVALTGVAVDITARKDVELALAARTNLLQAVLDGATDCIFLKDRDGRYVSINAAAAQELGRPADAVLGHDDNEILDDRSAAQTIHEHDHRVITQGSVETFENRIVLHGEERFYHSVKSPLRDTSGNIVGIIGVWRDITPLKRAQERARLLLEFGAALAAAAPDYALTARCIVDQLVPRLASRCKMHVMGPEGELRLAARASTDPEPPGDDPAPDACDLVVRHALASGRPFQSSDSLGVFLPLVARGRALGCLSLERRPGEPPYGHDEVALADDVARRAALALDNARLYGDLREQDRLKDEFLATLAHELRNPLAPVRHAVELLRLTGAQDDRTQGATDVIERQLHQLTRLVDDLLDVSRITRGQVELRRERVALAPLVTRVVESVQPAMRAAGHRLEVTLPSAPVALNGDQVRLGQVFENLLLNAAKYTPRGGAVALEAALVGDSLEVSVADTGIGISSDMLPQIFEVFTQAPESRALAGGGLGVGLAIVKRFVEMHGGSVEATSAGLGFGSRFLVRLPVDRVDEVPDASEPVQPAEPVCATCRVLVVDDNVDSADTLAAVLELMGVTVTTSHDGPSALEAAHRFRPDVALLDLGLPGMDGYELARRFRASPELGPVMLVAVTGWGQPEDRRRTRDAGFDHHLVKPVDLDALRALVAGVARSG